MDSDMKNFIEDILEITTECTYHFREICGLTFTFKEEITTIKNRISSCDIKPVGIIYEENDQYYLAPIDDGVKIEEVVKEFVEKKIKIANRN